MCQVELVEKIETHLIVNRCPKSCHLWDNMEKYGRDGHATDDNIIRRTRFACWL